MTQSKSKTFSEVISELEPSVFLLQETKLKRKGYFAGIEGLSNFKVFELRGRFQGQI